MPRHNRSTPIWWSKNLLSLFLSSTPLNWKMYTRIFYTCPTDTEIPLQSLNLGTVGVLLRYWAEQGPNLLALSSSSCVPDNLWSPLSTLYTGVWNTDIPSRGPPVYRGRRNVLPRERIAHPRSVLSLMGLPREGRKPGRSIRSIGPRYARVTSPRPRSPRRKLVL